MGWAYIRKTHTPHTEKAASGHSTKQTHVPPAIKTQAIGMHGQEKQHPRLRAGLVSSRPSSQIKRTPFCTGLSAVLITCCTPLGTRAA